MTDQKTPVKSTSKQPAAIKGQPAKPTNAAPKPARGGRSLRWVWLMFGLTGTAMLSATAGALLALSLSSTPLMQRQLTPKEASVFNQGDRISKAVNLNFPELTRPVNILVLGVKVLSTDVNNPPPETRQLRYQATINSFEGLTDTMLLLRFDPQNRRLAVLSVPRDTRTEIEGHGIDKINVANVYGGPALSAKATSDLLGGVQIDRYVRINVQGVQKLVDALGGVNVYVPKDIKYRDDSQHFYVNLKAGSQHLDGDQALQLLRFRYDGYGDIGRIQRQQMVMRALMEQALNPSTLGRIPSILSVIQSHLDTNLSVEELVALVGFATQLTRSNVDMLMVPGNFGMGGPGNSVSYWFPNHERITNLVARYFDQGLETAENADLTRMRIAVQDSTKQEDAVKDLRKTLNNAGFNNVYEDTPWSEPLQVTRIIAQQGNIEDAAAVRRSLGFGEIRTESTGSLDSDVTIQVGKDWVQRSGGKR